MAIRFAAPIRLLRLWCGLLLLVGLAGCLEPYAPDVISNPASYLVVNGFINARGRTRIQLSRTTPVATPGKTTPPEQGAALLIEAEQGNKRYLLREIIPGTYISDSLQLTETEQYRLRIVDRSSLEYASAFVPVILTPPIDSVRWTSDNTSSITIRLDTKDETNRTRYLRWQGIETWETPALHNPTIEFLNGEIRPIRVRYPRLCWSIQPLTPIQLTDLTPLSNSAVRDRLFQTLPILSKKLFSRYSLLVQQYAISKEEYEYWTILRKNTEGLGTLSDPQPVQLTGNVQCLTDPTQPVLGYVGAHSQAEKRIFINRRELLNTLRIANEYDGDCEVLGLVKPKDKFLFSNRFMVPVDLVIDAYGNLSGYSWSTPYCIDCRLRGTAIRPSYWPIDPF